MEGTRLNTPANGPALGASRARRNDDEQASELSGSPLSARDKILNSAEALFAERGYYGVTLREITKDAGVDLALVNYYFGPKLSLFNHVLGRRAEEHSIAIQNAIDRIVNEAGDKPPTVEAILRSWAEPVFHKLAHGGSGWRNYIHLLAYLSNSQQQQNFMQPMHDHYDSVMRQMIALLKQALPTTSETSICRSFYITMGALIHIYSETGGIDRLSDGACQAGDLSPLFDHLVPFLAAGFYRMAEA